VSGAQKWNGTALTLNAKPTSERKIATVSNAGVSACEPIHSEMPLSVVVPVSPKISDMP